MKYKGFLLATAGGIALAPVAQAADLPIKAAPYLPPPLPTWQGWYVGLHAGAAWQDASNQFNACCGYAATVDTSHTSFIGGAQVGYNWQNGTWVYGLEADLSGLSGSGSTTYANRIGTYSADNKINWLSTFRGRMGYAPNNWMFYVTGGLAVGGVDNTWSRNFGSPKVKSESKTRVGWTVGGGIEYLVNPNWTVAFEGLYVDLGSETVSLGPKSTKFENTAAIFRVKANYKW
jgi:outer membrane immunogenic protein